MVFKEEKRDREPGKEKKKKACYWWLSLGLILLLLAGGGYYALTGMRQAAHKLAGGSDYDQFSANSFIYDGGDAAAGNGNYFPLDEEAARAQAVAGARSGRSESSLARKRGEPAFSGAPAVLPASAGAGGGGPAPAGAAGVAMAGRLQVGTSPSGGAAGAKGPGNPASRVVFQGGGAAAGKVSVQAEKSAGAPEKAGRGSVLDALKGAFATSLYGVRLISQDAAKSWIARSFDATPEADTAIKYDEDMRVALDRIDPDSIPGFLREQDLSAAGVKKLSDSEVLKPSSAAGKDYPEKKLAGDLSSGMFNGLFAGISGTGAPENGDDRAEFFSDPEDERSFRGMGTLSFGGECGCTVDAPCCCLPGVRSGVPGDFPSK